MPHIRPKNGKEPPQLPFVAQTFQFVSLVFHGGTAITILLPLVAQTFQFVSVEAKTESLRYGTFAVHQRFSLKNGVRTSEILSVATAVILEGLPPTMHIDTLDYPLIHIPAGEFTMGTIPTGMRKTDPEEPQRSVLLDAYAIGTYQVTNAQYARFVDETGNPQPLFWTEEHLNAPDFPVVGVSWQDATNFLEWLNGLENMEYRLPSEAEWEKAARGTDAREYPWGDIWDASRANTSESGNKRLVSVGSYPEGVSPYGCYDMAGNAYDWCSDWFHMETYKYSPTENPLGASEGRRKVIRGGSWIARGEFASRCASRAAYEPIQAIHSVSFRIAMDM